MSVDVTLTVTGDRQNVEVMIKIWEILTGDRLLDDLEEYAPDISFVIECLIEQAPYVNDELLDYFANACKELAAVASGKWRPSAEEAQP